MSDEDKAVTPYMSKVVRVVKGLLAFLAVVAIIALLIITLDSRSNVSRLSGAVERQAKVIERRSPILDTLGCQFESLASVASADFDERVTLNILLDLVLSRSLVGTTTPDGAVTQARTNWIKARELARQAHARQDAANDKDSPSYCGAVGSPRSDDDDG